MPTNRTRRSRNPKPELSEAQVECLLIGGVAITNDFNYPEDEKKADWEKYKDKLMDYWLSDLKQKHKKNPYKYINEVIGFAMPGGPFTRPWAWWAYEAPEPRKTLTHNGIGYDGEPFSMDYREGQKEYLIRMDLLTENEQQILEAEK